jgi:hypothetical protein
MLEYFTGLFGGSITETARREKPNWKPRLGWKKGGSKAISILKQARPYLVVKGEQADLLIEYWENKKSNLKGFQGNLNKEEFAWRESIYNQVRKLNRRGIAAAETKRKDTR